MGEICANCGPWLEIMSLSKTFKKYKKTDALPGLHVNVCVI